MKIQVAFSWHGYPVFMKDPSRLPVMRRLLSLLLCAAFVGGSAIAPAFAATAVDPEAAEQLLTRGGLTAPEQLSLIRSVAQAQFDRKDYLNAVLWFQRYIKSGGSEADARPMLANAYYGLRDYTNAARELQWEIQADERVGRAPPEDRLLMLQSCYARLNDANAYAWALEKLVTHHPKRQYWADLLERTQRRPDFGARLSLEVSRLRLLTGTLGGAAEFVNMATQVRLSGYPAEAKQVMDQGFAAGVLGTGVDAQRHRELMRQLAAEALAQQRQASQPEVEVIANRASDGIELFNLGWTLLTLGDQAKGLAMMEQGIRKGGLANKPHDAMLRLGIGYMTANQKLKALEAFKKVGGRHGAADLARMWNMYARNADAVMPRQAQGS